MTDRPGNPPRSTVLDIELANIRGLSIRLGAVLLMLVGLGLIVCSFLLNNEQLKLWQSIGAPKVLVEIVTVGLMRIIGTAFFTVGFIDVLLGLPNFVRYLRSRVQEALIDHGPVFTRLFNDILERDISSPEFLGTLNSPTIERARHNLIVARQKAPISPDWQSSCTLADSIEPLLAGVTYKNLKVTITNDVCRDNGTYIRSTRYYRAEYTTQAERTLDLGFRRTLRPLTGFTHEQQYQLTELIVDNNPVPAELTYTDACNGDKRATLTLPLTVKPDQTLVIERREVALIPPTDTYIWVCRPERSLLCLNVDCRFTNEDLHPRITPLGFPKDGGGEPREDEREAHLTWEGWMLPHHGFVLSWNDPDPAPSAP